jgi:hypothetical protein
MQPLDAYLNQVVWALIAALPWLLGIVLPLSAGFFDVCYISRTLGGPLSGAAICDRYPQH